MNKDSEEAESGELFDESFDFKQITWKISNALSLPDLVDYKVQSPAFSYAGAMWKLLMFPYGQTKYTTEGYIDLNMLRMNSQFPEHRVFYKFCFIAKDGTEYGSYLGTRNFNSTYCANGCIRFKKKSLFTDEKDILLSNGVLTIMCQMRTKKVAVTDRYSQVESIASSLGCDSVRNSAAFADNKTLRDLKELFLKQEDCDVTINVKEQEFRAHKAILIARSPVFASTFRNDMKEKSTGTINIEDCDPSSFSDFLCFIYCGNVEILTVENVFGLFTAADKYDVQDLRLECLEFMKRNLSVDTFCEILTLALRHLERELINLTTDFFAKHWQEILVTVKWQSFIVENPIQANEIMVKALILKK